MLSFGMPSSSSVYTRFFFFFASEAEDLVFCCFGGGSFGFLETRDFVGAEPENFVLPEEEGLLGPLETCFERTVLVGAILELCVCWQGSATTFSGCARSHLLPGDHHWASQKKSVNHVSSKPACCDVIVLSRLIAMGQRVHLRF